MNDKIFMFQTMTRLKKQLLKLFPHTLAGFSYYESGFSLWLNKGNLMLFSINVKLDGKWSATVKLWEQDRLVNKVIFTSSGLDHVIKSVIGFLTREKPNILENDPNPFKKLSAVRYKTANQDLKIEQGNLKVSIYDSGRGYIGQVTLDNEPFLNSHSTDPAIVIVDLMESLLLRAKQLKKALDTVFSFVDQATKASRLLESKYDQIFGGKGYIYSIFEGDQIFGNANVQKMITLSENLFLLAKKLKLHIR